MVDSKASLAQMRKEYAELDKQVRSIIGTHVEYDAVAREIEGAKMTDIERRWDSLTTRISETEERVAQLRTQQGELAQEMKQLGEDARLTTAQLELSCIERKIAAAARRWQTLAMASCLLEDVCGTFERERQPETLREASSFLNQLTDGKYNRIWTPLGTNRLKIDDTEGKSLPLEVLSRGTREAVFIALRLSLAAAYARRGVMLPLVLDDVLVNFDRDRAIFAARTLKTFAELGHQVMMFTCHEHIVDIFHDIDVQVRMMPAHGEPGRAEILEPEERIEEEASEEEYEEAYEDEPEDVVEEEVLEEETAPEPEPVVVVVKEAPKPTPKILYVRKEIPKVQAKPEPVVEAARPEPPKPAAPKPEPKPAPRRPEPKRVKPIVIAPEYNDDEIDYSEPEPSIQWAWFEREPERRIVTSEDKLASVARSEWTDVDTENADHIAPEEAWDKNNPWWGATAE